MDRKINTRNKADKGRPKKSTYNKEEELSKLLFNVDSCYEKNGEIQATAEELGLSTIKVKKLLITSGKLEYEETKKIQRLLAYGKSLLEVQNELGMKKSSINSYLPYSKNTYKGKVVSSNADRCDKYRKRKIALESIKDDESLRECLRLFAGYRFETEEGEYFSYEIIENYQSEAQNEVQNDFRKEANKEIQNGALLITDKDKKPCKKKEDRQMKIAVDYVVSLFANDNEVDKTVISLEVDHTTGGDDVKRQEMYLRSIFQKFKLG